MDIADECFLAVPPERLAATVADPARWRQWWPDLDLTVTRDRGVKGQQWAVTGALTGSMEVWLEPVARGTVVHWFLRADPSRPVGSRRLTRLRERRVLAWKAHLFEWKDQVEGFKGPGNAAELG